MSQEKTLINLDDRNQHKSNNIAQNEVNKLFPPKHKITEQQSQQSVNSVAEKSSKSNDKSSKSIQNTKKDGHHNIYINTKDKDDYKNKKTDNKAQIKATDGLWKTLNFTQDQYKYF